MKALYTTAKLATVAFAIASYIMPATAAALPENDRTVFYHEYPDGPVVGVFIMNCMGHSSMEGVRTPYQEEFLIPCS
jgi:hypothetical protein